MSHLINRQGAATDPVESFADTVRYALTLSSTLDGVSFWSEGGCDREHTPVTNNDLKLLEKEYNTFVKIADGDTEEIEAWNSGVYYEQEITIYIYGKHVRDDDNRNRLEQIRNYIDAWLFERARRPDEQWRQQNPMYKSSILHLGSYSIDWERHHDETEDGITDYLEGTLLVRSQRCHTP